MKSKAKTLLHLTGNRDPRPAKERVPSDPKEQGRAPAAPALLVPGFETHVQFLGQGPPPQGVIHLPPPPHGGPPLLRRGRWRLTGERGRRVASTAARQDEQEDGDHEGGQEHERRPQRLENRDYAVAGAGGQGLHRCRGRHGRERKRGERRRRGGREACVFGIYSEVEL